MTQLDAKLWRAVLERWVTTQESVPGPGPALTAVTSSGSGNLIWGSKDWGKVHPSLGDGCVRPKAAHVKPYGLLDAMKSQTAS